MIRTLAQGAAPGNLPAQQLGSPRSLVPGPRSDDLGRARGLVAEHEESETIQGGDGRWYNVYGRTLPQAGQPLPLLHPWEQASYATSEEAVAAARRRSDEEGRARRSQGQRSDDLDRARGMTASAVPLAEFIQRHLPGSPEAMPTDPNMGRTVQTPAGTQSLDRIIEEGSQAILKAMERDAAGWPEGTRSFLPDTLTDAQPIHRQIETAPEEFPETFHAEAIIPRPGEPVTPRERRVLDETMDAGERGRRSFVVPEAV